MWLGLDRWRRLRLHTLLAPRGVLQALHGILGAEPMALNLDLYRHPSGLRCDLVKSVRQAALKRFCSALPCCRVRDKTSKNLFNSAASALCGLATAIFSVSASTLTPIYLYLYKKYISFILYHIVFVLSCHATYHTPQYLCTSSLILEISQSMKLEADHTSIEPLPSKDRQQDDYMPVL